MRKQQAKKLPLAPDPKFGDIMVTRFINCLMWGGKKSTAQNIFYDALDKVEKTLDLFNQLDIPTATQQAKEHYSALAFECLDKLPVQDSRKQDLKILAEYLLEREK